jgi:hypothetical protein
MDTHRNGIVIAPERKWRLQIEALRDGGFIVVDPAAHDGCLSVFMMACADIDDALAYIKGKLAAT